MFSDRQLTIIHAYLVVFYLLLALFAFFLYLSQHPHFLSTLLQFSGLPFRLLAGMLKV